MAETVVQFEGAFHIWWYSPSHGRLLLRSAKSAARPTQIDILFVAVTSLQLPDAFQDLLIERVRVDELPHPPVFGVIFDRGLASYRVSGRDFTGYVVALSVQVHESDREHDQESPLAPSDWWKLPVDNT